MAAWETAAVRRGAAGFPCFAPSGMVAPMTKFRRAAAFVRRSSALLVRPADWPRFVRVHWHRLMRLPGTAHSVALGTAIGVAVSFVPIFGFRFFTSMGIAALFRASPVAGAAGSHFGNPIVYPLLFVLCVELGGLLTGQGVVVSASLDRLGELLVPAVVGLTVAGGLTSLATYVLVARGVRAYQERRRARLTKARRREEIVPCRSPASVPRP